MANVGKPVERMKRDLFRKSGRLKGDHVEFATRVVGSVMDSASAQGQSSDAVSKYLSTGAVAFRAGVADHDTQVARPDSPLATAACRNGCAFCCILPGKDGALITAYEARQLHAALAPLAGMPDGRQWNANACPALDPVTLKCRAYSVRPVICRAYFSSDVEACKAILRGEEGAATAVLAAYPRYLSIQALVRLVVGVAKAPTYSLARFAAAVLEGQTLNAALRASKHAPVVLEEERKRTRSLPASDAGTR